MNEELENPLGAGQARLEYARMLKDEGSLEASAGELDRATRWFSEIQAEEGLNDADELRGELDALMSLAVPGEAGKSGKHGAA